MSNSYSSRYLRLQKVSNSVPPAALFYKKPQVIHLKPILNNISYNSSEKEAKSNRSGSNLLPKTKITKQIDDNS